MCAVLTNSADYLTARKYWNKLKQRLKEEGNETVSNCHQLKMLTADGRNKQLIQDMPYNESAHYSNGIKREDVNVKQYYDYTDERSHRCCAFCVC